MSSCNRAGHGGVPLIKKMGQFCGVAVDAQDELREVIGADRKSVESGRQILLPR